jgi:hypothetical protein
LDIIRAAYSLRDNMTRTPASLLAVCVNHTFFCRAETGTRCLSDDMIVDIYSQQICLFVCKSKGDQRRDPRDKLVLAVPIPGDPLLADLLDDYLKYRTTFCATFS